MYFSLIDKIVSLTPGKQIVATKSLAMGEEYLRDHFPKFPVLPGVLMIEAMTQSCAWLTRVSEDFAHSMVLLKAVKNVKFGRFLQPGKTLTITANLVSEDEHTAVFKAQGEIEEAASIRAQLFLSKYNWADTIPNRAIADKKLIAQLRQELTILWDKAEMPQ